MKRLKYKKNAIWKIALTNNDEIFAAMEQGMIRKIDGSTLTKSCEVKISDGWINGLHITDKEILIGTSLGEIFRMSLGFEIKNVIRTDLWINEVRNVNGKIYAVAAEGIAICINEGRIKKRKISRYQLIDILYFDGLIVIADTEGGIIYVNEELEILRSIRFNGYHITKMDYCRKGGYLYFATTNGFIGRIDKKNGCFDSFSISRHRIWGIIVDKVGNVYAISSGHEVFKFDIGDGCTVLKKILILPTSCTDGGNHLIIGKENGTVTLIQKDTFDDYIGCKLDSFCEKVQTDFDIDKNFIIIFYEKDDPENNELCEIYMSYLKDFVDDVITKGVGSEDDMKRILFEYVSWNRLPIVLFYGIFVSGGRTLLHMFETGTITRICGYMKEMRDKGG